MANILQVTGPSLNPDHRNISDSQRAAEYGDKSRIRWIRPVLSGRTGRRKGKAGTPQEKEAIA